MFPEEKVNWRDFGGAVSSEKSRCNEFLPPLSLQGLISLRSRQLSSATVLVVLEAFRRTKTRHGDLVLSAVSSEKLGLTCKERRTVIKQLGEKAQDLVSIEAEGNKARVIKLTDKGKNLLEYPRAAQTGE